MANEIPFRTLPVGAHFRFPDGGSFHSTAKKVSARCYVWSGKKAVMGRKKRYWSDGTFIQGDKPGWKEHRPYKMRVGLMKSCVGSVDVAVVPSGRKSPLKRRGGHGRGGKQLGRYRR